MSTTAIGDVKVSWERAVDELGNLIKFAARKQATYTNNDSYVAYEDFLQEGMIKLYECWLKWCVERQKDMDEFKLIFSKSLFRKLRQVSKRKFIPTDIDTCENILMIDCSSEDIVESMFISESIIQLQQELHNPIAVMIVKEALQPSTQTQFEAWADKKRREMLKSQGKKVHVPKSDEVKMKHIKLSLNLTTRQYDTAMTEIKRVGRTLFNSKDTN